MNGRFEGDVEFDAAAFCKLWMCCLYATLFSSRDRAMVLICEIKLVVLVMVLSVSGTKALTSSSVISGIRFMIKNW